MSVAQQKTDRGRKAYASGLAAEGIVERDYLRRGQTVVARRWRGKWGGEIDLICRDGDRVVFVEVKQSRTHDRAVQHLTRRQIERIYTSANEFLASEPKGLMTPVRFDVALVDGIGAVRVIENATMGMW